MASTEEHSGGSVNYYRCHVAEPTSRDITPYTAECNDIIEVLEMTPAMANIFKAVWRMAASLQGLKKKGLTLVYDAEKTKFFAHRLYIWACKLEKKEGLTGREVVGIVSSLEQQKEVPKFCKWGKDVQSLCKFPACDCAVKKP